MNDGKRRKEGSGIAVWISLVLAASMILGAAPSVQAQESTDPADVTSILDDDRKCSGTIDYDCEYCSYEGGSNGQDHSSCENYDSYYWRECGVFVSGSCYVGFTPGDLDIYVTIVEPVGTHQIGIDAGEELPQVTVDGNADAGT